VKSAIAFHVDSFGLDPRYLSKHDFPVSARNSRAKSGSHTWSASKDRSFVGGRS
jgi:hypothetical protein